MWPRDSRNVGACFQTRHSREVQAIVAVLHRILGLTEQQSIDVIATATSMAGALWQMATPRPEVPALYRADPALAHAIVEVGPRRHGQTLRAQQHTIQALAIT